MSESPAQLSVDELGHVLWAAVGGLHFVVDIEDPDFPSCVQAVQRLAAHLEVMAPERTFVSLWDGSRVTPSQFVARLVGDPDYRASDLNERRFPTMNRVEWAIDPEDPPSTNSGKKMKRGERRRMERNRGPVHAAAAMSSTVITQRIMTAFAAIAESYADKSDECVRAIAVVYRHLADPTYVERGHDADEGLQSDLFAFPRDMIPAMVQVRRELAIIGGSLHALGYEESALEDMRAKTRVLEIALAAWEILCKKKGNGPGRGDQ